MTEPAVPGAARPVWIQVILIAGIALFVAIGLPSLVFGIALVRRGAAAGPFIACLGLLLSAFAVGGLLREVVERSHRRNPPAPRLTVLSNGERALHLPRAAGPSLVSAWSLVALALVCLVGAGFAVRAERWILAGLVAVAALVCLLVAQPHRARALAGGLTFTPSRIVHEHDGVRWEVPWPDVYGALPQEPMPVLVYRGRMPAIHRTWVAGRYRGRAAVEDALVVQARYLAGGAVLAAYVIGMALVQPEFRSALGSPAPLPPGVPMCQGTLAKD